MEKALINAVEDAKENGVVTLTSSPDIAKLRKHLKLTQKRFADIYHINPETLKKMGTT